MDQLLRSKVYTQVTVEDVIIVAEQEYSTIGMKH